MYNQYPGGVGGGHVRVSYRREPNFLERMGSSLAGSVLGVLLVIGACVLLFWNEGRSVYTYNVIMEAQSSCKPVANIEYTSDFLNNELVYLSGRLSSEKAIEDTYYGVSVMATRLRKKVEMYQWIEESRTVEHKEPDGRIRSETHYSYTQAWKDHVISSSSFDDVRYQNPREMPVAATKLAAERVTVGAYTLGNEVVSMIGNWRRLMLTATSTHQEHGVQLYNNMLYHGNPSHPQVGDVRLFFEYAGSTKPGHEDHISVVAQQRPGYVLSSFPSRVHPGYKILYVHMGRLSLEATEIVKKVFSLWPGLDATYKEMKSAVTWGLRFLGLLLVFIGFSMITGIVVTLVDWLPVVRELIAISSFLLSLMLAFSLTLVVVAVAWIRYRPLYGLAVLIGAVLPFLFARFIPDKMKYR